MVKKYIFFHICTIGPYETVTREMMNMVSDTGTLQDVEQVYYGVIGDHLETAQTLMSEYPKTTLIEWGGHNSNHFYERFTLHHLHRILKEDFHDETCYIMYMHTKGISSKHSGNSNVHKWRSSMAYGLTMYREMCWSRLHEGMDAVGMYFRGNPSKHFSGNFWWASSDYLKQLRVPIANHYLAPEMWIGQRSQRCICISEMSHGLYSDCATVDEISRRMRSVIIGAGVDFSVEAAIPWERVRRLSYGKGAADDWFTCLIPAALTDPDPVDTVTLPPVMSLVHFSPEDGTDHHASCKKQFKIEFHDPDIEPIVVLEDTPCRSSHDIPPEKTIPIGDITKCIFSPQNRAAHEIEVMDCSDRLAAWKRYRYRWCNLTNTFCGKDAYPNEVKMIILKNRTGESFILGENDRVYFV